MTDTATEVKANPFDGLKENLKNDEGYAYSWHCNIAMACYDAIRSSDESIIHKEAHKIGNDAASRFMKNCFDVKTEHK